MPGKQEGFTLIEIVIAFTILAMGSILTINIITQSSIRVVKVNENLAVIDVVESAVATVRKEIEHDNEKMQFAGIENDDYRWTAQVLNEERNRFMSGNKSLPLYFIRVSVFNDDNRNIIELTTIVPGS